MGKFHFTSSRARYFTMCGSTLFHVLRKQNISLYAFRVLVKKDKKRRRILTILRLFSVGRCCSMEYCSIAYPLTLPFFFERFPPARMYINKGSKCKKTSPKPRLEDVFVFLLRDPWASWSLWHRSSRATPCASRAPRLAD